MEELSVVGLNQRKESVTPLTEGQQKGQTHGSSGSGERPLRFSGINVYPMAVVLRLRVLQIVCGISAIVMGSVAFIEERIELNLSLGIPAGAMTVLAAAVSIHKSRGLIVAVTTGTCGCSTIGALWAAASALLLVLLVQCARTFMRPMPKKEWDNGEENIGNQETLDGPASSRDLVVLACVQAALALTVLVAECACSRIDCAA